MIVDWLEKYFEVILLVFGLVSLFVGAVASTYQIKRFYILKNQSPITKTSKSKLTKEEKLQIKKDKRIKELLVELYTLKGDK